MAAYRVGDNGSWWAAWELPGQPGRDATPEESAIMDKIVWQSDTPADRERLRQLLKKE